jgi:hypothetical protein
MEESLQKKASNTGADISKEELFKLHDHYASVIKDELDFFFKYLNFYIGIISALFAGTITGLLSLKAPYAFKNTLIIGPFLIVLLAIIGWQNVKVYYRRFLEALITTINIKTMLGFNKPTILSSDLYEPLFRTKYGGFITQFNRPSIKKILEKAEQEGWCAEDVFEKLLKHGDTLQIVIVIFSIFGLGAILLAFIIFRNF